MQRSVAGWLQREALVLLGLRSNTGSQAERWELPGGKVDPGESDSEALIREFLEECNMLVAVGESLAATSFTHQGVEHHVRAYRLISTGVPTAGDDHREVRFVPLDSVLSFPLVPSDRRLIQVILRSATLQPPPKQGPLS